MRHIQWALVIGILLGCGANVPGSSSDSISDQPLSGTVAGKPFTARSAFARMSSNTGYKLVTVIDVADAGCGTPTPQWNTIVFPTAWDAGTAFPLDFHRVVTFTHETEDGGTMFWLSNTGRVEVVSAPSAIGAVGQVRLRSSTDAGDSVEGQFDVEVCN